MVKFLKLANRIINPKYISQIHHYTNTKDIQYAIHISPTCGVKGINFFGLGFISTNDERITIFKESSPECYKAVEYWIKDLE
jgi:hypothetical protein